MSDNQDDTDDNEEHADRVVVLVCLLLLPSAMHCGNFARFISFLNKGTITSSTRAQNCSDNCFEIFGVGIKKTSSQAR